MKSYKMYNTYKILLFAAFPFCSYYIFTFLSLFHRSYKEFITNLPLKILDSYKGQFFFKSEFGEFVEEDDNLLPFLETSLL